MQWWDSYRAVYGAELRAAAREFGDHGWSAVGSPAGLLLVTGTVLDVLEMPAETGRHVCARLRDAGLVVPVAATPADTWWFPVAAGSAAVAGLARPDMVAHTGGEVVLAPPSELPDGWVHWRVSPAQSGWELPRADVILAAAAHAPRARFDLDLPPGAQRPAAGVAVAVRS
ncbi:MAG: hypothetical protein ACT4RN_19975 [Pseudonocardia sp.]